MKSQDEQPDNSRTTRQPKMIFSIPSTCPAHPSQASPRRCVPLQQHRRLTRDEPSAYTITIAGPWHFFGIALGHGARGTVFAARAASVCRGILHSSAQER